MRLFFLEKIKKISCKVRYLKIKAEMKDIEKYGKLY